MKRFKKWLGIVLCAAMVLTMGVIPSFAADGSTNSHTITINNINGDTASHTYAAYQVFAGDYDATSNNLSNIKWGSGVDGAGLLTALKQDTTIGSKFTNATTAAQVAEAMKDFTEDQTKAFAEVVSAHLSSTAAATGGSPLTVTGDGYYFVKDTDTESGNTAKTRYILQVVKNVEITAKSSVTTVEKKVKEKNDTNGNTTGWQDAADYDIGDEIPYQITGSLPSTFADYKTYKTYTFTDTLSSGLKITDTEKAAITVKVGETDVTSHFDINKTENTNGTTTLTVSLKNGEDLKAWTSPKLTADSEIVVDYSATLDSDAVIGSAGNPNTVNLTYSNNPNAGGDGDKGTTPDDKVTVFTYEINALKLKATDDTAIDQDAYDKLGTGEKDKYVKVGDKYQKTTALEGAGFTLYKKVPTDTKDAVGGYIVVKEITPTDSNKPTEFVFKGTDAGEYKLVETTVPAGYNKAEDITFTVNAEYNTNSADPKLTKFEVTPATAGFTVTTTTTEGSSAIDTNGVITGKILNQKGSTLPSTGGMGTTMLYIGGAALIVLAGVLLFFRKRKTA